MDLQLKQWRRSQNESEEQASPAKIPKLVFDQSLTAATSALPLFAPEPEPEPTSSKLSSLSGFPSGSSSRSPKMRSFFSWNQWQELELQALIYRYMLAGAAVPQELLLPIRKSLLHRSPSYFLHHPLQHFSPPWGYEARAVMDPEPGRCRRTDGKKWRCSRDVVVGHKYCERHMHRGRNRSRKPVEIPTPPSVSTATATATAMANAATTNAQASMAFGCGGGQELVNGQSFFFSSCSSQSSQLLNISQSCSEIKTGNKNKNKNKRPYEAPSHGSADGGHILRRFFDDWPRGGGGGGGGDSAAAVAEMTSSSSPMSSATSLTISMPGNPSSSSDVSLKLSTGNEEEENGNNGVSNGNNGISNGREQQQSTSWWGGGGSGGPLAEALRSSVASSASPTSVLHQLGITTQAFH